MTMTAIPVHLPRNRGNASGDGSSAKNYRADASNWRTDGKKNSPMLFDTNNPTGGDVDLRSTGRGNIVIISTNGRDHDPNDEANGGTIIFTFENPVDIESVLVFDTEEGGTLRTFDQPLTHEELVSLNLNGTLYNDANDDTGLDLAEFHASDWLRHHNLHNDNDYEANADLDENEVVYRFDGNVVGDEDKLAGPANNWAKGVPHLGDNQHVRVDVGQSGVYVLTYTMWDSGGIDDIRFKRTDAGDEGVPPPSNDQLFTEFVGTLDGGGNQIIYPRLTN
ncbi:MAG: hypothetical protein AAF074_11215 [Pseudomonadota bacterium]